MARRHHDLRMRGGAMRPSDMRSEGLQPKHAAMITMVERPFNACYKVPNVASLGPGITSDPYAVYWPVGGIVRGMRGCIVGTSVPLEAMGSIGVTITILDGREDLFKSAGAAGIAGPDFNIFASLFGQDSFQKLILERPVTQALAWQVRFHNFHASLTFTPDLTFYVDEDPRGVHRFTDGRVEVPENTEVEVYSPSGRRQTWIAELD